MEFHWSKMLEPCLYYNLVVYNVISEFVFQLFVFWSSVCLFQLALGQGARRFHVAAALNAKAKVAMSRFEPSSCVNYDQLRSNIDIVRKRSESISVLHSILFASALLIFNKAPQWLFYHFYGRKILFSCIWLVLKMYCPKSCEFFQVL